MMVMCLCVGGVACDDDVVSLWVRLWLRPLKRLKNNIPTCQ